MRKASKPLMDSLLTIVRAQPEDFGQAMHLVFYVNAMKPRLSAAQWRHLKTASLGISGLIEYRRCRATGYQMGIYDTYEQGIESDLAEIKRDGMKYSVICETHSAVVCVPTLYSARRTAAYPGDFCEECQSEIAEEKAHRLNDEKKKDKI